MFANLRTRCRVVLQAAVLAYAAVLALRPLDEADTFFHLSLGRAVLRARARTVPEPTAFFDFTQPAVAAEWLWSLLTYALYQLGGYKLLSWLAVALAMAAAYGVMRLVREYWDDAAPAIGEALLVVLVLCAIQCRVVARPQLLLLAILPAFLLCTRRYTSLPMPRRFALGCMLALGVVIWAQAHGSFVLAPVIFVIQVAPSPRTLSRAQLRVDGCVLLLILAAILSSPYGLQISGFIGSHAAGDAPRYIQEMSRPTWPMLDPLGTPSMLAFWIVMALGLCGMFVAARVYPRELSLMLLGIALLATANRFVAEAMLFATPWAARSIALLALHLQSSWSRIQGRGASVAVVMMIAGLLAWNVSFVQKNHGPLFTTGLARSAFPLYAGSALANLPAGSAVLTDYPSSAPIGFLSDGRLRTFVDGRTPLYFDDTDFAVQREMMRDGQALRNGLERYGAIAAVVRRDSEACVQLSQLWAAVMIEPLFTTFLKSPGTQTLTSLRPCGTRYVNPEACADRVRLSAEIARVRNSGDVDFATFLQVEAGLRCSTEVDASALQTLAALEPLSRPYALSFRRTQVEALLVNRHFDEATSVMLSAIADDDPKIIVLLEGPAAGLVPLDSARRVLSSYIDVERDDADVGVRSVLADICARAGAVDCARTQAVRAAVRGRGSMALDWVAHHHPDPRVRRDAQRWHDVLNAAAK